MRCQGSDTSGSMKTLVARAAARRISSGKCAARKARTSSRKAISAGSFSMSMAAALAPARCRAKLASASGRARADETQPRRDLDRLRAPGGAELRCGVAQVETHRRYRQRQDGADLAVGLARRR